MKRLCIVLLLIGWMMSMGLGPGTVGAQSLDGGNEQRKGGSGNTDQSVKMDPVLEAFALPRGMVLTTEELEYAKGVRAQLEPQLRSAYQQLEQAAGDDEKLDAAKEIKRIKTQIRNAVQTILQRRMMIAAQQAAKKQAEAIKKLQAQHNKKKQNGKKKHKRK